MNYNIEDFKFSFNPFSIQIGNNVFSNEEIHIDIKDDTENLKIFGDIRYTNSKNINTSVFSPNIMVPFSYISFMECNHAILSMQNAANGFININGEIICFDNDKGYIEKDWGYSFPKSYIWAQGNNFLKTNASFMISIADVPFKLFTFKGIICVLLVDDKEYKFTTYNNTKLIEYKIEDKFIYITIKKCSYILSIKITNSTGLKLSASVKGKMEKDIFESITALIDVTLKKGENIIFSDSSTLCGLEIVLE